MAWDNKIHRKSRIWILSFCRKWSWTTLIYIEELYMNLLYVNCALHFLASDYTKRSGHMTPGFDISSRALTYNPLSVPLGLGGQMAVRMKLRYKHYTSAASHTGALDQLYRAAQQGAGTASHVRRVRSSSVLLTKV